MTFKSNLKHKQLDINIMYSTVSLIVGLCTRAKRLCLCPPRIEFYCHSHCSYFIYIAIAALQQTTNKTNGKNIMWPKVIVTVITLYMTGFSHAQRSSSLVRIGLLKPTKLAVCGNADYTATNLSTTLSKFNERALVECIKQTKDKTATSDNLSSSIVVLKCVFINLRVETTINER